MVAADRDRDPLPAHLDALALRLFALLMLFGGAVLLLALGGVLMLPRAAVGNRPGFLLPVAGTRHVVAPLVVPLLAGCGGLLAGIGLVALWFGWYAPGRRITTRPPISGSRARSMLILIGGLAALALMLARR